MTFKGANALLSKIARRGARDREAFARNVATLCAWSRDYTKQHPREMARRVRQRKALSA